MKINLLITTLFSITAASAQQINQFQSYVTCTDWDQDSIYYLTAYFKNHNNSWDNEGFLRAGDKQTCLAIASANGSCNLPEKSTFTYCADFNNDGKWYVYQVEVDRDGPGGRIDVDVPGGSFEECSLISRQLGCGF